MTDSTKERIIKTTLEILGSEGIHGITIRRIAELSHVNVASLNYHFGSKDALIKESMMRFGSDMLKTFGILNDSTYPPEERINQFLYQYMKNVQLRPGIIRSIFSQVLLEETLMDEVKVIIKEGFSLLLQTMKEISDSSEVIIKSRMIHIMSSLIYPALFGNIMHELFDLDFSDPDFQDMYLNTIINDSMK